MKRGIPGRGDILRINLDPSLGVEQEGTRPVVVLTPEEFNRFGLILACSITQGGAMAREHGFAVSLLGAGVRTQGVVLCHQVRTLDPRERKVRYIETLPSSITEEILARVRTLVA